MEKLIRVRRHFIRNEDNQIFRTMEFTNTDSWESSEVFEDKLFSGDDEKIELFLKISESLEPELWCLQHCRRKPTYSDGAKTQLVDFDTR